MNSQEWSRRLFFSILTLAVICVHLSDGSSISRENKSERHPREKASDNEIKPQKKTQFQKKYKQPPLPIEHKKSPKNKLKISDLRPCISKAFCEVNSITEEPTYETNQEFYMILNRLKKFIDDGEKADLNGSGSDEDDYSGSSEESYERVPYMRNNDNGPHRSGSPPYYRRGKSLAEMEAKLKKKKIKKLAKSDTKSKNGTQAVESLAGNSTKPAKIYTPAQIEQRAFVDRKTQELNVVDDLAALIKISAEIGQALKSPRRCRSLFKKCRMTYEQIIRIFNRTQSVETSDQETGSITTPEPFLVVETLPTLATDSSSSSSALTTTTKTGDQEDVENTSDGDGNRNKKSRTDFSDDEDPEYATDSETESQPVKTYSLFSTSQVDSSSDGGGGTGSKRQEAMVDEAFHKFEKVFPSSGAAEKTKLYQNQKGSISSKLRPVVASSSEEEESNESSGGSGESRRTTAQSDYNHRSSAEDNSPDSEEVEMEVPDKKIKTKHNTRPIKENAEIAGEVDEAEDDSDAEIASSEIGKKPEDDDTGTVPKKAGGRPESSSEETSVEDDLTSVKDQPVGDLIYTRDEDKSAGFNSYGFYPQVRPTFSQHPTKSVKSKGKRRKGNKKGQKEEKPQNDQTSSEEDPQNPEYMPPEGSDFYQMLKQVDDGKGASVIPGKGQRRKKSKSKRRPGHGQESQDYGDYQDYPGSGSTVRRPGYGSSGGRPSSGGGYGANYGSSMERPGYGSGEGPQSDDQQQQPSGGFLSSIMGWFSRGSKSAQVNNDQTGPGQYSTGFFGSGWGNGNKLSPQEESDRPRPSYNGHQKYSGEQDSEGYNGPSYSGTRRQPQKYGGDRNSDRYPSSQENPPRRGRHPPPQARGGDSSEEEEEEDEEPVRPIKRQIPKRRQTSQPNSIQQSKYTGSSSGLTVSGPPPPLVIEPTGEDALEYANQRNPAPVNTPQKQANKQKASPPPIENSEESKEYNSSEEKVTSKQSHSSKKQTSNKKTADDGKVFSGMFASAAEIDKQIVRDKEQDDDRDDAGLLLSTFDSVSNSFSTSADKIRDWSKEDNSRKKINVGQFATNTRGKYTVKKNRNKVAGGEGDTEAEADVDKNENRSSEEEEEKR